MARPNTKKFLGKARLFLNGIFLVLSILTMAVATFAWFTTNRQATDKITLKTDDNAVSIDAYAYHQGYEVDSDGDPIPSAYSKNQGTSLLNAIKSDDDSEGNYRINFSSEALETFAYGNLYSGELAMSESDFPHLYVELRYLKPALNGFIQATIADFAYASNVSGSTNITQELNYQYRFTTVQNTFSSKHVNGLRAAYGEAAYPSSAWTSLGATPAPVTLYNSTSDISGYSYDPSYTPLRQCFIPGFSSKHGSEYYFSKATVLEFRVDPLAWVKYFNEHPGLNATNLNFGLSFNIALNFSSTAFFSNAKAPKLLVSKPSVNFSTSGTANVACGVYNFTQTPTITPTFSVSGIASATVSGTNVTLGPLGQGNTLLTLTATAGSQTASAIIAIGVYGGPTLVLSPSALTLTIGESGLITAEAILFSNSPSITAVSSNANVASAIVASSSIIVQALASGTATITVSGRDGNSSVYSSSCQVTVQAGTRTLLSISVATLPSKTSYVVGEAFGTVGLVVVGNYSDGASGTVSGYRLTPSAGTVFTESGSVTVGVSYASKSTSFSVNVTANNGYKLVTAESCLIPGERYLIASSAALSGTAQVLGASQESDYRSAVSATVSASTPPTLAYTAAMETLTLNGNANHWTFNAASASGYLRYAGNGSALVTAENDSAAGTAWSIAFDATTGRALIQSASSTGTYLQFDSASGHYLCGSDASTVFLFTNSLAVTETSLSLVPSSLAMTKGDTAGITASLGQGTVLVSATLTDPTVASLTLSDNYLELTGLKAGSASIIAIAKGNTGSITVACPVVVTEP